MFLVKSAFWLTAAFLVLHPGAPDLTNGARALADQAVTTGQQMAVAQLLGSKCSLAMCNQSKMVVAAAGNFSASAASPKSTGVVVPPAPIPRPRPEWMG